jgi:hypothetical protein
MDAGQELSWELPRQILRSEVDRCRRLKSCPSKEVLIDYRRLEANEIIAGDQRVWMYTESNCAAEFRARRGAVLDFGVTVSIGQRSSGARNG